MWRMVYVIAILVAGSVSAEPVHRAVTLTNEFRAQKGLKPLRISPVLEAVAERHGRDMARRGFFSHRGSDGSTPGRRARRHGYRFCVVAENILRGYTSADDVIEEWKSSKGHRKNMLLRKATEIGVIRHNKNVWVMVVGSRMGAC